MALKGLQVAEVSDYDSRTALHLAGDMEGAEIALRKSMELEATDLGAEHLGILYYYSGRLPEAREMFRLALALLTLAQA